jgi:hypothetical protein
MLNDDRNAKSEFQNVVLGKRVIACDITHEEDVIRLKTEYTSEEYEEFLNKLDFEYDSGFGGQNLYGTIWCADNIWLERGQYDGSEWWVYNEYPEIEESIRNLDREREKTINKILD